MKNSEQLLEYQKKKGKAIFVSSPRRYGSSIFQNIGKELMLRIEMEKWMAESFEK